MIEVKPGKLMRLISNFVCCLSFFCLSQPIRADEVKIPSKLPLEVTDSNVTISFTVDSTWHLVKGTTSQLQGRVWLENPSDFLSLRAELTLPVDRFATGGESRDERMKEVMQMDQHPNVVFRLVGVVQGDSRCVVEEHACVYNASGTLTISGQTKRVQFPVHVRPDTSVYEATAEIDLQWADYGVEDPSILIAKLDPTVSISAKVVIPKNIQS